MWPFKKKQIVEKQEQKRFYIPSPMVEEILRFVDYHNEYKTESSNYQLWKRVADAVPEVAANPGTRWALDCSRILHICVYKAE